MRRAGSRRRPAVGLAGESGSQRLEIPQAVDSTTLTLRGQVLRLTNLRKLFRPQLNITKRDLLQYYADIARVLLPHLLHRAMVMKRYPNGAGADFFFMKRAPSVRPPGIATCFIAHASGNNIGFPVIEDLLSLLWMVNLGCIDLNPWSARCDDIDGPDYLHFDLDPVSGATFGHVLEAALRVQEALKALEIPCYPKTTGSRGIHVYVPIVRGPVQRQVWRLLAEDNESPTPISPLSEKERGVLRLLAAGKSPSCVLAGAQNLPHTLNNHMHHINHTLHTRSRLEAVLQAARRKLI